jgi:hypothetical protein
MLIASLRHSRFSCLCPIFKRWCRRDRSHVLLVPVARRQSVVSATMALGASGTRQGTAGVKVAEDGPRLGDSTEDGSQDLVLYGYGAGFSGLATPGDVASNPGPLSPPIS